MKKTVALCLVLVMIMSLAACGSKTGNNDSKKDTDSLVEATRQNDDIGATYESVNDSSTVTAETDADKNSEAADTENADKTSGDEVNNAGSGNDTASVGDTDNSGVTDNTDNSETIADDLTGTEDNSGTDDKVDAGSADLYSEFKAGTPKAKFTGAGERSSYLDLSSCLEVGESYTVDELVAAIETVDPYLKTDLNGYITYKDIDCGSDGIPELLMMASFGDEFSINIVFKEIDGELRICYDQDSWSRCYTEVSDTGFITTSGSSGASVHDYEEAFIDADGNYVFLYGFTENMTLFGDFYAFDADNESVAIPTEGLDIEHICIMDYYFEPDYQDRIHYYYCIGIDDDFSEVEWDEDYKGDEELVKRFSEAGVELYTKSEVLKMVEEKRAEYGLEFKYV